jgi:hypothetical protein
MENVSFTFEDAQRISDTVQAVERSKFSIKPIDQTGQGDEFVIIYVSATTKYSDGSQNGNLSYWNETDHLFAQYSPTQTVRVRAANTADTLPVGYVFARFQGVTTRSDSSVGPLYIAVGSSASGSSGGSATIDVVTDVMCGPEGLTVSTVTFSGADYDNAVIRNFLALNDVTQKSYVANQGRCVVVNAEETGLEFGPVVGEVADTFIGLTDTPQAYGSTNTYKVLTVSSTNAGVSFSDNNITTKNSIKGGGNPNNPNTYAKLELVGDVETPTANTFYGVDSNAARGWYQVEFTSLKNVPNSFSGQAGKFLKVNIGATALEFAEVDLATIQSDISTLQTDISTLQTDVTQHGVDIADILSRLSTAETNITTLQTDLSTAQSNISSLDGRITALENA